MSNTVDFTTTGGDFSRAGSSPEVIEHAVETALEMSGIRLDGVVHAAELEQTANINAAPKAAAPAPSAA